MKAMQTMKSIRPQPSKLETRVRLPSGASLLYKELANGCASEKCSRADIVPVFRYWYNVGTLVLNPLGG